MAISKHLLFSVLFLVGFLLASSHPADNRRPSPSRPRPPPPRPRPPPPRPSPPPPSPRPPPPRPSPPPPSPRPSPPPPPPRPSPPPPPRPSPPPPPPSPPPPTPSPPPPPSPPINPPGFNYFLLSLQWPNALCSSGATCNPPLPKQHFTIRGLWPRRNFGLPPIFCNTDEKMTDDILEEFRVDLLEYWPRLQSADNFFTSKLLWIEQWYTYGSCSSNRFPPEAYLETAISLAKEYGPLILEEMEERGIEPDGSTPHTAEEILDAITAATNAAALITCSKNESGKLQLDDIRLCVNINGETLQNCHSNNPQGNCNEEFIFPSPPTDDETHSRFPSFLSSMVDAEEAVGI